MARYKITCCMACQKREPGCHGECEEYKSQRAEYDETKAEKMKAHLIKLGLDGFLYDGIYKSNKRTHYRSKYRRSR